MKHISVVHEGNKVAEITPKMCEQCGKWYKSNEALQKHIYTHTKISPFKCDICWKMFPTKYKLKEHKMRHEGTKNFVCLTCGVRKTTGQDLRNHMVYHKDTKIPCKLCPLEFFTTTKMKRHMRVVHFSVEAFE